MQAEDWPAVEAIYKEGIAMQIATFERNLPAGKVARNHHQHSRLVVLNRSQHRSLGGAEPRPPTQVYAGVAEVSIYVAAPARGKGHRQALLKALIEQSEQNGTGRCKLESFPKTLAASRCSSPGDSERFGLREKNGRLGAIGEMFFCWNVAVQLLGT